MNEFFSSDVMSGKGMVWMDICVMAALWFTTAVAVYVSCRLGGDEPPHLTGSRWVMACGFLLIASMLTLRFRLLGDLPMSPPYASGLMLICAGTTRQVLDRLNFLKKDTP